MTIVYIGIDLAKSVFAIHGVDDHGKPAIQPKEGVERTVGLLELRVAL